MASAGGVPCCCLQACPLMDENPCEAVLVNATGSRNVADKRIEYDVEMMVMVSTDKAVNPTNIMGCTKRLAEIYVQTQGVEIEQRRHCGYTKFVTTRFGNVLGSNSSVIPRFREQIAKGGPITVTRPEITHFFMAIPEACTPGCKNDRTGRTYPGRGYRNRIHGTETR